jgi:hypothetical protein
MKVENSYKISIENTEERDHLEYVSVHVIDRIILKWILRKWSERLWTGFERIILK